MVTYVVTVMLMYVVTADCYGVCLHCAICVCVLWLLLRSISEISSCFFGPRPWHIEIRHRVKKTSTIKLFGFETLRIENSKIEIMETDRIVIAGVSLSLASAFASSVCARIELSGRNKKPLDFRRFKGFLTNKATYISC